MKLAVLFAVLLGGAAPAVAQSARPAVWIAAGAGVMNADLAVDSDTAPVFSLRVTRRLPFNVAIEFGVAHANLQRRFGRYPLTAFEGQLQYHLPAGRFTPYAGAGAGLVRDGSEIPSGSSVYPLSLEGWNPSISIAGGTRMQLNDRIDAFGELRFRGIDWDFRSKTTDIIGGLAINFY